MKILTDMTTKLMQKLGKGHLEWVQQAIKSFVAHLEATGDVSTDNALFTSSTDPETLWKLILDEHRWLRFLAVRLLAIVPHATDVERLFIMMGCFNSDRRATKEGGPGNAGQGEDVPGQHEVRVQVVHVTQDPTLRFAAVQYQDLCNILFHCCTGLSSPRRRGMHCLFMTPVSKTPSRLPKVQRLRRQWRRLPTALQNLREGEGEVAAAAATLQHLLGIAAETSSLMMSLCSCSHLKALSWLLLPLLKCSPNTKVLMSTCQAGSTAWSRVRLHRAGKCNQRCCSILI